MEAVNSETPSLAVIKKHNIQTAQALLTIIVADVVMFFNVGKTMNEQQLLQTIELILQEYYWLKPSELKYCFQRAKLGRYGNRKLYDRIDGAVLFEWIDEYCKERDNHFEQVREEEHKQNKQNSNKIFQFLVDNKMLDRYKQTKDTPVKTGQKKERVKTDQEKTIQFYLEKYWRLRDNNPVQKNFLLYRGEIVDATQYCEKRLRKNKILK